jgi:hypothetical protein
MIFPKLPRLFSRYEFVEFLDADEHTDDVRLSGFGTSEPFLFSAAAGRPFSPSPCYAGPRTPNRRRQETERKKP